MKKTASLFLAIFLLVLGCSHTVFAGTDAEEAASDAYSVSICTFNKKFGSFQSDTTNMLHGSACLSYTFGTDMIQSTTFSPLNISAYDSIEFDFYVSDALAFSNLGFAGQIELTSSGGCDVNEMAYNLGAVCEYAVDGFKDGWNHIILPISSAFHTGGAPNLKSINFLRIYAVSVPSPSKPITIKFDNMRATKHLEQYKAELTQQMTVLANRLQALGPVPAITAENFETIRDNVRAIRAVFDTYDDIGQAQLQVSAYQILLDYENALYAYEAEQHAVSDTQAESLKNEEETTGCRATLSALPLLLLLIPITLMIQKRRTV